MYYQQHIKFKIFLSDTQIKFQVNFKVLFAVVKRKHFIINGMEFEYTIYNLIDALNAIR